MGHWLSHTLAVQAAIYEIDSYFEETHRIVDATLTPLWHDVETALFGGQIEPREDCGVWLARLREYELLEKRIHEDGELSSPDVAYIVSRKMSDVALARALIWSYVGESPHPREAIFWSYFDECAELVEDLIDLQEDLGTWNLNLWLYPLPAVSTAAPNPVAAKLLLEEKLRELTFAYKALPEEIASRLATPFSKLQRAASEAARSGLRVVHVLHSEGIRHQAPLLTVARELKSPSV